MISISAMFPTFYIYEYRQEGAKFLERRSVTKYCNGNEGCDGNGKGQREGNSKERLNQIFDTIKDCSCVVAMRIGESPKQEFADKGIVSHDVLRENRRCRSASRLSSPDKKEQYGIV